MAKLLLAAVFAFFTGTASADVISEFAVAPSSILAGQAGTVDLTLSVASDPGTVNARFTSGSVTLFAGNGDYQTFSIDGSATFQEFIANFTYPDPGSFTPSFSAYVTYT